MAHAINHTQLLGRLRELRTIYVQGFGVKLNLCVCAHSAYTPEDNLWHHLF